MSSLRSTARRRSNSSLGIPIGNSSAGGWSEYLSVQAAYALQSSTRGRAQVSFGNLSARGRVEDTIKTVE